MWSLETESFLLILFLQCHQSLRSNIVPHLHSRYPRQPLRACRTGSRTLTQMKVKQCEVQSSDHINSPSPLRQPCKTRLVIFKVLNTHSFPNSLTAGTRRPLKHTRGISKMGFRRAHRSTGEGGRCREHRGGCELHAIVTQTLWLHNPLRTQWNVIKCTEKHADMRSDGAHNGDRASLPQARVDQEDRVGLQFQLLLWVLLDPVNNQRAI